MFHWPDWFATERTECRIELHGTAAIAAQPDDGGSDAKLRFEIGNGMQTLAIVLTAKGHDNLRAIG